MITSSFLPSERNFCRIGLLERLPLHTPYPAIAARIIDIVRRLPRVYTTVIVDRTGAHAAYDMLVEKGLSPLGLTISGGDSVHWDRRYVTVPKMRLLTGLLSISYRGELEISKGRATTPSSAGSCRISVPWRPTPVPARHGAPDEVMTILRSRCRWLFGTSKTRAPIWASGNFIGAGPARRLTIIVSPSISARASTTVPSASCPAPRRRHQSPAPSNPWNYRRVAASSICRRRYSSLRAPPHLRIWHHRNGSMRSLRLKRRSCAVMGSAPAGR